MTKEYESKGYSSETIEFGQKPAILVVDLQLAFTDPKFPNGDMPMVEKATNKTSELLDVARNNKIPVASCYTAYDSLKDMPLWKVKAVGKLRVCFLRNSEVRQMGCTEKMQK